MPRIDSNTADRDYFLNSQDIRNIAQKLAQLTWKLHGAALLAINTLMLQIVHVQ